MLVVGREHGTHVQRNGDTEARLTSNMDLSEFIKRLNTNRAEQKTVLYAMELNNSFGDWWRINSSKT